MSDVIADDAEGQQRQYYRTPSPLRHHFSIVTDNCAYMNAMQQVDYGCMQQFMPQGVDESTQPIHRTPSPQYRSQGYSVPELTSLANFIAPRTLPTVKLPAIVTTRA